MPSNLAIFSHNLLTSHIGSDHNNCPLLDPTMLSVSGTLLPLTKILENYLNYGSHPVENNFSALTKQLAAELRTMLYIAGHCAYSRFPFRPADFAGCADPAWLAQSPYRLVSFTPPACAVDIPAAVRVVAEAEASLLYDMMQSYCNHSPMLLLMPELFAQSSAAAADMQL